MSAQYQAANLARAASHICLVSQNHGHWQIRCLLLPSRSCLKQADDRDGGQTPNTHQNTTIAHSCKALNHPTLLLPCVTFHPLSTLLLSFVPTPHSLRPDPTYLSHWPLIFFLPLPPSHRCLIIQSDSNTSLSPRPFRKSFALHTVLLQLHSCAPLTGIDYHCLEYEQIHSSLGTIIHPPLTLSVSTPTICHPVGFHLTPPDSLTNTPHSPIVFHWLPFSIIHQPSTFLLPPPSTINQLHPTIRTQ